MRKIYYIIVSLAVVAVLQISAAHNYLLFHTLAEMFTIIIACSTFMVAWNSRRFLDNQYLLFIGVAYLFIGILDMAHTFSYKGMAVLSGYDANAPTQLWIAARYVESATLLVAPLMLRRRTRPGYFLLGYGLLAALLLLSIFHWRIFPDSFIEGAGGLTLFKKASEYIICLLLLAAGIFLIKSRHHFDTTVLRWLLASILATMISEICFTTYASVYGAANQLGHYFKIFSFYGVYKAIIQTALIKPYDLLFRDLKLSKERLQSLFANMIDGFATHEVILDANGKPVDYRFLEVNAAFRRLTGLNDVIGRRATEVIPGIENDPADWIGRFGKVAETGRSVRFESYSQDLGRWYSVAAYLSGPGKFATIFEDITERKKAQENLQRQGEWLRASEARFRLLSDTASRLLATDDPQALVEELCRAVMIHLDCQVFFNFLVDENSGRLRLNASSGIPVEEARKIEWLDFGVAVCGCVARDRQRIIAEDIFDQGDPLTELVKSYGVQAYCCHPLMVEGTLVGTLSFGTRTRSRFASDEVAMMNTVADQVALAMQRLRIQRGLKLANEALEHKVKERTATLANTVDTLQEEIELRIQAEDELRAANEKLSRRADQLRALAGELTMAEQRERKRLSKVLHDGLQQQLAITKLQMTGLSARLAEEQLVKTAAEIVTMLDESIRITRSLSADLSPPILLGRGLTAAFEWLARWMHDKHGLNVGLSADPVQTLPEDVNIILFESTRELLFNVVKHSHTDTARVRLQAIDGAGVRITVSDQGDGFNVDRLKPEGNDGGGFGLFSIRERIGLIGGCLEIESAPGKGSRFTLLVPLDPASQRLVGAESELILPDAEGHGTCLHLSTTAIRVIIADDHALFRDGVARLVDREPDILIVGRARDGQEAIELARELKPDVILMDINMPGINGIEATKAIHRELPRIRIIGLSMHEELDQSLVMQEAGAFGYKSKCCPASELVAAIRECRQ